MGVWSEGHAAARKRRLPLQLFPPANRDNWASIFNFLGKILPLSPYFDRLPARLISRSKRSSNLGYLNLVVPEKSISRLQGDLLTQAF
jgi:hypothetical protein